MLRARLHLVRGELADARAALEALTARHPGAFGPLMWLGITLLEEGRDLDAAERTLLAALAIYPNHAVCRKKLDLLRQRRPQA